jgi:hypothetical protein
VITPATFATVVIASLLPLIRLGTIFRYSLEWYGNVSVFRRPRRQSHNLLGTFAAATTTAQTNKIIPPLPLDTYSHCHLSSDTETLITLVGLLPAADDAFRRRCPRRWYGSTYHTRTPRQWAVQFFGLNITRAYARHLYTCRTRLSSPSTIPNPGYGSLFRMWRFSSPTLNPATAP